MNNAITSASDKATVSKILAIRASVGNKCETCPTCTRPATDGFHLCVDACHVPHVLIASNRGEWLNRQQARAIRRAELARISL